MTGISGFTKAGTSLKNKNDIIKKNEAIEIKVATRLFTGIFIIFITKGGFVNQYGVAGLALL